MYEKRGETRASQNLNLWSLTLLDSKLVIITVAVFISWGRNIILCYFTSRETESRPGALRSWLTLDGCELFGAEEIKYPSFWSLWPQ